MHVPGSMCMWVAGALGVPKGVLGPLKLEWQAIVTDPVWVLGTKLGSSVRTVCALNGWAVSAFSHFIFKNCVCVIYVHVHAHVYAEVRGQSLALFIWQFETRSFHKPGAHWLARFFDQLTPNIPFSLSPQHWDQRCAPPCLVFLWGLGGPNSGPQVFTASISPSPQPLEGSKEIFREFEKRTPRVFGDGVQRLDHLQLSLPPQFNCKHLQQSDSKLISNSSSSKKKNPLLIKEDNHFWLNNNQSYQM